MVMFLVTDRRSFAVSGIPLSLMNNSSQKGVLSAAVRRTEGNGPKSRKMKPSEKPIPDPPESASNTDAALDSDQAKVCS